MGDWYIVYGKFDNGNSNVHKHGIVCAKTVAEAKSKVKNFFERRVDCTFEPKGAFRLDEKEVYV